MYDSEENLISRIDDMIFIAKNRNIPMFTNFLDDYSIKLALQYILKIGYIYYDFFGGNDICVRKMLGVFPEYYTSLHKFFPIKGLTANLPNGYKVSHRDVLGSLMGLKITRDSIGDIFIFDKSCVVFLRDSVFEIVKNEWNKIGKIGVKITDVINYNLLKPPEFKEISGTVSSMRLDSVISLSLGVSRTKACDIIKSYCVKYNGKYVDKISFPVKFGDEFSVKRYGKYKVQNGLKETRKGRLLIKIHKYL